MVGLLRAVFFFIVEFWFVEVFIKGQGNNSYEFFELTDSRQFHVGFII